jgi:FixJ family two-component response regulator/signal transduction histidine kinase
MKLNFKKASILDKQWNDAHELSAHCILIVDDEAPNLSSLERIFSKEYPVVACSSAKQALDEITNGKNKDKISVIISDQIMPVMSGVELFQKLNELNHPAPRIMLTGFAALENVIEAVNDAGIFRYLKKPIDSESLLQAARDAVRHYEITTENKRLLDINTKALKEIETLYAGLERQVEERTRMITNILHHVKSGFFLINENCLVQEGFTSSCHQILGKTLEIEKDITDILELYDREREHFKSAVAQIFEDQLPEEVLTGNLKNRYKIGPTVIAMESSVIRDEKGQVGAILFTINDATKLHRIEQKYQENQALLNILNHRSSFAAFIRQAFESFSYIRETIGRSDQSEIRAILHTIKGSCAVFGLLDLSHSIHEVEDETRIALEHIKSLEDILKNFLKKHEKVINLEQKIVSEEFFEVRESKLEELKKHIDGYKDLSLSAFVDNWMSNVTLKKFKEMLGPVFENVDYLAAKAQKEVELKILGGDVCVNPFFTQEIFANLVHLIRNSLDHGIEKSGERGQKPQKGQLILQAEKEKDRLKITFSDDGRGIDVKKIKDQLLELHIVDQSALRSMTDDQVIPYIFHDSFSTASEITPISGRGVGLASLKAAVDRVNGHITVETIKDGGTKFVIVIPHS